MGLSMINELNNKRLQEWKESQETVILKAEDIIITEPIHTRAEQINFNSIMVKYKSKQKMDKVIVIRKIKKTEQYRLVMGLKWLTIAKLLNLPVTCIVVKSGTTHSKLRDKVGLVDEDYKIPEGTEELVPLNKVKVAEVLARTIPSRRKYEKHRNYFLENNCIDRPITVIKGKSEDEVIVVDEYIRFLILARRGVNYIPVRFQNKENIQVEV